MPLLVSVLARRVWIAVLVAGFLCAATQAQSDRPSDSGQPATQQSQPPNASDAKAPPAAPEGNAAPSGRMQISSPASSTPVDMLIGPGDEGDMTVYGVPELSTHFRVESSGDAYLPLIGKFHMAGLSADAAQAQINEKYESGGFLHNPHVTIYIKEYMTQGISVMGEVTRPGIYSAMNARRLYDLFLIAGGLTARAGKTVTITHSKEPNKPVVVTLENGLAANQANVEIQPTFFSITTWAKSTARSAPGVSAAAARVPSPTPSRTPLAKLASKFARKRVLRKSSSKMAALAAWFCKAVKKYSPTSSPPASIRISPSKNFSIPANSPAIFSKASAATNFAALPAK